MKKDDRTQKQIRQDLTEDFWRNVKAVDATDMMTIFPKKNDLEKAVPKDPEHCVYAECIRRVAPRSRRIRIWRNVALVESRDPATNEIIVLRYMISAPGKRALRKFDQGIGELVACSLLPPPPSRKLDARKLEDARLTPQQRAAKTAAKRKRRQEIAAGIRVKSYTVNPRHAEADEIRNGKGHGARAHRG